MYGRDCLIESPLEHATNDDIIIQSDLDEIILPEALADIQEWFTDDKAMYTGHQKFFMCHVNRLMYEKVNLLRSGEVLSSALLHILKHLVDSILVVILVKVLITLKNILSMVVVGTLVSLVVMIKSKRNYRVMVTKNIIMTW